MNDTSNKDHRSGFVAIAGAPNAGKSTLLNRILGAKLSITSKKPQTTRNRILGVLHNPDAQLVFIDTPGVHRAKEALNVKLVETALSAIGDVDVILLMVDASAPDQVSEGILVTQLKKQNRPVLLALNKIDQIKKTEILGLIDRWARVYDFKAIIPISAKHGDQVETLVQQLEGLLPPGPPLFPEDTITDLPQRFFVAEMVREKAFRLTGQEIPYSVAVTVDEFSSRKRVVEIHASIHVERDSQKGILIGKGGSKLKKIGEEARLEIEKMVGRKVLLKLFVRVQKNWSRDTKAMRNFGYY